MWTKDLRFESMATTLSFELMSLVSLQKHIGSFIHLGTYTFFSFHTLEIQGL